MSQPSNTFGLIATISLQLLDYCKQEICIVATRTMSRAAVVCSHYQAPAEQLPSSELMLDTFTTITFYLIPFTGPVQIQLPSASRRRLPDTHL